MLALEDAAEPTPSNAPTGDVPLVMTGACPNKPAELEEPVNELPLKAPNGEVVVLKTAESVTALEEAA